MRISAVVGAFLFVSMVSLSAMAEGEQSPIAETKQAVKDGARAVGQTARETTTAIGHGTRDAAKAIGHGTRDAVRDVGKAAKGAWKDAVDSSDQKTK